MPLPALAAGLIAQGANSAGSIASDLINNSANRRMAEYAYSKDLEMWNRQNEYNLPSSQMQRLRAAGLNPNMVYGSGSVVGNTSASLPKYNAPTQTFKNPLGQINPLEVLGQYQNIEQSKAQTDLIRSQQKSVEQKTINDSIVSSILGIDAKSKALNYQQSSELYPFTIARQLQELDNSKIRFKIGEADELLRLSQIETEKSKKELLQQDILFKQYENRLRAIGITSSDHPIMRILVQALHAGGVDVNETIQNIFK